MSTTPRPGSAYASQFYTQCHEVSVWQRAVARYDDAVKAVATKKKHDKLVALDHFWRVEYAPAVRQRGHITMPELSQVMQWKLARGKFRPLQKLCDSNAPTTLEAASKGALKALDKGDWKAAKKCLTSSLKAVGEATATALLCPFAPSVVPFMADEVLDVVCGKRAYTHQEYDVMRTALVARAEELGGGMDAEAVGRAVWVVAILAANGEELPFSASAAGGGSGGGAAGAVATAKSKKRGAEEGVGTGGNGDGAAKRGRGSV